MSTASDSAVGIHATLVRVAGAGVLLSGPSGIGKSQLALELIHQGQALVADDHVLLSSPAPGVLLGQGNSPGWSFLAVRGLGVLDIQRLFGTEAVLQQSKIHLLVKLTEQRQACAVDPLRGQRGSQELCGIKIPSISLCVSRPGLTTLVMVAARDALLREQGYHADETLISRLGSELTGNARCA